MQLIGEGEPIHTSPNAQAASTRVEEFTDKWGQRYPAIVNLWRSAWEEFIVFLDDDVEIRKIICSTDEIVNSGAARGCCARLSRSAAAA